MNADAATLAEIERMVATDPADAVGHVRDWLAGWNGSFAVQLQAMVLLARAQRNAGHLALATSTLAEAVRRVEQSSPSIGEPLQLSALIRATAETYANHGRARAGIGLCRRLAPLAADAEQVDLLLACGALHRDAGDLDEARRNAEQALVLINELGDAERECRLLNNRGVLNLDLGDFEAAEADFLRAEQAAEALGLQFAAASCVHNRGVALGRQGQMHRALELLDRSASYFEREGHDFALLEALLDRVTVLLDSGLNDEARTAARLSAAAHARLDARAGLETTRSLQSRIEGADGNWAGAVTYARQAVELVRAAGGDAPRLARAAARLRLLELVADEDGVDTPNPAAGAGSVDATEEFGVPTEALDDSTAAEIGIYLVNHDRPAAARRYLRRAAQSAAKSSLAELHRCVARAQLARLDCDSGAVERWVSAGLEAAEHDTVCLAATDIRTLALRRIGQLGDLGLRVALDARSALDAAWLIDRVRAVSLQPEPHLSEREAALVARLREIRHDEWQHGTQSLEWSDRVAERARVEAALRASRRHQAGERRPAAVAAGAQGLRHPRDTRLFLRELDGRVVAVVVRPDDSALIDLGRLADLRRQVTALALLLDAIAARSAANHDVDGLVRGLRATFAPVLEAGERTRVVVVSDAAIPLLPWSLLTSRPVTMMPSITAGRLGPAPVDPTERLHVISGPELAHADSEVEAIRHAWGEVELLTGPEATVDGTLDAFSRARLVHVIAHGRFRPDNPLFSEVRLGDGPLTFFDLLSKTTSPRHIVFVSCEVGRDSSTSSLGAYSMLSSRGCVSMVASCGLVRDPSIAKLMGRYYARLAASASPSEALAGAQHELLDEDRSLSLLACFGPA